MNDLPNQSPPPPTGEVRSRSTTRDAARFLFKYLRFVMWFTALVLLFTTALVYLIPPSYVSTGVVLVERGKNPTARYDPNLTAAELDTVMNSEIEIIKSRELAEEVVDRLGLLDRPQGDSAARRVVDAFLDRLGNLGLITRLDRRERLVSGILRTMEVRQPALSDILRISYSSDDPHHAREVAHAIMEVYLERHRLIYSDNTAGFLESRASEILASIGELQTALDRATGDSESRALGLQLEALEKSFLLYSEKVDRARAASLGDESLVNIRVVDYPALPTKPRFARLLLITAGTLAGAVLAIALAFLREHFDHRVHSLEELEDLDVPLLVSVRSSGHARIAGRFGGRGPGYYAPR